MYWRLFDRLGLSEEELFDDIDCLAQLKRTNKPPYKPTSRAHNAIYEYCFDPAQEFKSAIEKYLVLDTVRADGKNISITYNKEGSRLGEGYIARLKRRIG